MLESRVFFSHSCAVNKNCYTGKLGLLTSGQRVPGKRKMFIKKPGNVRDFDKPATLDDLSVYFNHYCNQSDKKLFIFIFFTRLR